MVVAGAVLGRGIVPVTEEVQEAYKLAGHKPGIRPAVVEVRRTKHQGALPGGGGEPCACRQKIGGRWSCRSAAGPRRKGRRFLKLEDSGGARAGTLGSGVSVCDEGGLLLPKSLPVLLPPWSPTACARRSVGMRGRKLHSISQASDIPAPSCGAQLLLQGLGSEEALGGLLAPAAL